MSGSEYLHGKGLAMQSGGMRQCTVIQGYIRCPPGTLDNAGGVPRMKCRRTSPGLWAPGSTTL